MTQGLPRLLLFQNKDELEDGVVRLEDCIGVVIVLRRIRRSRDAEVGVMGLCLILRGRTGPRWRVC